MHAQVFQRYCAELSGALSGCTDKLASELYSARLITKQEKSQAVDAQGLTQFRKADSLMEAVERRIATENKGAPLKKFCRLLKKGYALESDRIVVRMNSCLGEWEK